MIVFAKRPCAERKMIVQVIPDVVKGVTNTAKLTVTYNGKVVRNGDHQKPSETQVLFFCIPEYA